MREFLAQIVTGAPHEWKPDVEALRPGDFESRVVGDRRLAFTRSPPQSATEYAVSRWWDVLLPQGAPSRPTFVGLNRLAELMLRANPRIMLALRATYPFVFVDEFQDTTYAQFDFLRSAFGQGTLITAVGDPKQRIMTWAGARPDGFERFEAEFSATRFSLLFNFRSSPDLVHIQHVVARALDSSVAPAISRGTRQVDGDVAQVWNSLARADEVEYLARWLVRDMAARARKPRDYALLVKQKANEYEVELSATLAAHGLRIRNENCTLGRTTIQDLLADDICRIGLALLRLGSSQRDPQAWQAASTALLALRAVDPDDEPASQKTESELSLFLGQLRNIMRGVPSREDAVSLAEKCFQFMDSSSIRRAFPEYGVGDLLPIITEAFALHLVGCAEGAPSWRECVDAFEGVSLMPMMTVHKSKGLEFDTIVFVGLDDDAWWSHKPGDLEGLATFFVALSRAKQRAIFSFCQDRGDRVRVAELFNLLTTAGVPEIPVVLS